MSVFKNCPNCAAPYEAEKNKCPYCGTSYYDMSALNFVDREPFYLKIKSELNGIPVYITQLVRPELNSMEITSIQTDVRTGVGNAKLYSMATSTSLTTSIAFMAIEDKNKRLCTIEIAQE